MWPVSPNHIAGFTSERLVIAAAMGTHQIRVSFIVMTIPTT